MASLNATDANMPVALESFDECANQPNEENQMASDDNDKASVEDDENRVGNDTLIDGLDDQTNSDHSRDTHAGHKTMEHIASLKGMIASDQIASDRSPPQQQQHQSVIDSVIFHLDTNQ